jgi:hypothetical protein
MAAGRWGPPSRYSRGLGSRVSSDGGVGSRVPSGEGMTSAGVAQRRWCSLSSDSPVLQWGREGRRPRRPRPHVAGRPRLPHRPCPHASGRQLRAWSAAGTGGAPSVCVGTSEGDQNGELGLTKKLDCGLIHTTMEGFIIKCPTDEPNYGTLAPFIIRYR